MSKYKIDHVEELNEAHLQEGVYLVLMHALTIPPHLLLIISGKVFSISTMGPAVDEEIRRYLTLIKKRRIKTLFIKIEIPELFTTTELQEKIRRITLEYPRVDVGVATCLSPIKDFCGETLMIDRDQILLVFDLLDSLKKHEAVSACYHLNLEQEIRLASISLDRYSVFEVNEAIFSVAERI